MDRKRFYLLMGMLVASGSVVVGQNALATEQAERQQQARAEQTQSKQGQAKQQQQKAEQQLGERSVIGKVTDKQQVAIQGTQHQLVKLENRQGETIVVDLGAALQEMQVEQGDRLIVIGKSARINERPVLYAQYAGELNPVGKTQEGAGQGQQQRGAQQQQQQQAQ
jgi:hypothetical protein